MRIQAMATRIGVPLLLFFVLFFLQLSAFAESIYKWVDKDGVTHYSSKPVSGAKPADLPEIMRGEHKVPEIQSFSCRQHGGIDCAAGPDKDGSVICLDGFQDSPQRFNFSCSAPKLQIAEISPLSGDGGFSVMVRNSKSVASQMTEVVVNFPDGLKKKLDGPAEIEGFGLAEFKYTPPSEDRERIRVNSHSSPLAFKPDFEHVTITCGNCP